MESRGNKIKPNNFEYCHDHFYRPGPLEMKIVDTYVDEKME